MRITLEQKEFYSALRVKQICEIGEICVRLFVRYPFVRSSIRPFVRSSVRPFVRLSVRPFVRLSVCPFVRLSVRLFVRLCVCPLARVVLHSSIDGSLPVLWYTSGITTFLLKRFCTIIHAIPRKRSSRDL